MKKYIPIGFTKKCHGVKGDLKIQIEDQYLEDFVKANAVFILVKGRHVPYFIENIKDENDLLLKLEEVDSKETANSLTSKELFLQPHQILKEEERELIIEKKEEDQLEYEKYIGFSIIDIELGAIGKIEEVVEFPQQEMAIILRDEKEILIPLHKNLIEKIEAEKQCIHMTLPDGILDL